jgi:hypothetical protein
MPYPKSVEIAGTKIGEVLSVNVNVNTPAGDRGYYEGRTTAATVQILRRARNTPTVELFSAATNADGRLNIISGKIVLEDPKRNDTYTIDMKEAYISGWTFSQPPNEDYLAEIITLKVGNLEINAGGNTKSFVMLDFNRFA